MAKLPKHMKTEYIGKRRLDDGRWVAEYDLIISWWGWPLVLLWGFLHPKKAMYWAGQDSCDGLTVREVKGK